MSKKMDREDNQQLARGADFEQMAPAHTSTRAQVFGASFRDRFDLLLTSSSTWWYFLYLDTRFELKKLWYRLTEWLGNE